jgi:hypothetical protein
VRPLALVLLSLVLLAAPRSAQAQRPAASPPRAEDLARARSLDQQGARAYGDGRYNDAIRYFEEAYRLGGPPFELWNIAKCHAKLDQPDQAADFLERYLATPTLPAEDREEATQQLEALRRRPSTLTLASTPSGATVLLDGKPVEGSPRTPTSFQVPPGQHTISLSAPGHATHMQTVEARYGRAIILDVPLGKERRPPPPRNPYPPEEPEDRRLALRAHLGVMLPKYGSVGGAAHVTGTLSGTYRFLDAGATAVEAGLLFAATGDSWDNTVGAEATVAPCGTLQNARSASAYSVFAMGGASWELVAKLRLHALGGAGIATYSADDLGGDLFVPACKPKPGPRPAMILGAELDYAITPLVRLSALPLLLQLQPSFEGTRSTPLDSSGIWLRATIAVGIGVDL